MRNSKTRMFVLWGLFCTRNSNTRIFLLWGEVGHKNLRDPDVRSVSLVMFAAFLLLKIHIVFGAWIAVSIINSVRPSRP